jgi:Flp pilus assembly protein TadB
MNKDPGELPGQQPPSHERPLEYPANFGRPPEEDEISKWEREAERKGIGLYFLPLILLFAFVAAALGKSLEGALVLVVLVVLVAVLLVWLLRKSRPEDS